MDCDRNWKKPFIGTNMTNKTHAFEATPVDLVHLCEDQFTFLESIDTKPHAEAIRTAREYTTIIYKIVGVIPDLHPVIGGGIDIQVKTEHGGLVMSILPNGALGEVQFTERVRPPLIYFLSSVDSFPDWFAEFHNKKSC